MLEIFLNRLKTQAEKIIVEERQVSEQEGAPQSRSSTQEFSVIDISSTSETSTNKPCLHGLKEGLQQGLSRSFVGNHEEAKHQGQPFLSHQTPL